MEQEELLNKTFKILSQARDAESYNEQSADLWANIYKEADVDVPGLSKDVEKTKLLIKEQLESYQRSAKEGFEFFVARDQSGITKQILEKLQRYMQNPPGNIEDLGNRLPDFTEEEFETLFNLGIDACEAKEYAVGNSMMAALAGLFPDRVQPYIAMAKIAFEQEGPAAGLNVFDYLTSAIKDPLLYFYAAMAYMEEGQESSIHKAEDLLKEGIELCNEDLDNLMELQREMQECLLSIQQ